MTGGRHRSSRSRRGRLRRALALSVAAAGAAVVSSAWVGAAADAPVKYGWWSQANGVAPVAPPAPPDVPAKGLYVENGFNGPTAIAALSFSVPTGATVGNLTLTATGKPVMTSPPIACAVTAAGKGYQPADNGAWADAPAYDCGGGQVAGTVASDGVTVTFPVGPLAHDGSLDVVILAVGPADRIPFNPPDDKALAVTAASSSTSAGSSGGGGIFGPGAAGGSTSTGTGTGAGAAQPPAIPPPADAGVGVAPDAGVAPTVAGPQSTSAPAGGVDAQPAAAGAGSGSRHTAATVLGLGFVIAALLFWTEGFGLLGGRVSTLAAPRSPAPAYPPEGSVVAAVSGPPSAAAHS